MNDRRELPVKTSGFGPFYVADDLNCDVCWEKRACLVLDLVNLCRECLEKVYREASALMQVAIVYVTCRCGFLMAISDKATSAECPNCHHVYEIRHAEAPA